MRNDCLRIRRSTHVCTPDSGDTNACKGHIGSIIDAVEVDDQAIPIIGSKDICEAAIAGKQTENGHVCSFVRKWRAIPNKNANSYVIEISL